MEVIAKHPCSTCQFAQIIAIPRKNQSTNWSEQYDIKLICKIYPLCVEKEINK